MARYKTFDVKARVVAEADQREVGFHFVIRDQDEQIAYERDFECLPEQSALSRLLWSGHWPDGEPATVIDIICSVLTPGEEMVFMSVLRDKRLPRFGHELLWPIANDLLEQYTARPTGSPASSANGRRGKKESSAASSPKPESTGDDSPSDST